MSVGSYLELFTTLYGWLFYNIVWDVLTGTGIVYLPFLGIILDNIVKPVISQESKDATTTSLRRMEVDLFSAMAVVILACQPYFGLSASVLDYSPVPNMVLGADPDEDQTITANDSTFGLTGFSGASGVSVNVPVMWYAVMGASAGINHAIIEGFPSMSDLRSYEYAVRGANIEDAALRQELNNFYTECYVPAKSQFIAEKPDVTAITDIYGTDDPTWIGSHVFLNTAGYYDSFRASIPIPQFNYIALRDTEYNDIPDYTGPGRPWCNEWWLGESGNPEASLKARLVTEFDLDSRVVTMLTDLGILGGITYERRTDNQVRVALHNGPAVWSSNYYADQNLASDNSILQYMETFAKDGVAAGGTLIAHLIQGPMLQVLLYALPMLQALLLLCVYGLLPFVLVFSRYSVSVVVVTAIGIFTIKFWSVLWHLATWVDNNLIYSMYPSPDMLTMLTDVDGEQSGKRMLLDLITSSLHIGLPVVFTGVMGWAGITIGRHINTQMSQLSESANQGANQAGSLAKGAGKGIAKKAA